MTRKMTLPISETSTPSPRIYLFSTLLPWLVFFIIAFNVLLENLRKSWLARLVEGSDFPLGWQGLHGSLLWVEGWVLW